LCANVSVVHEALLLRVALSFAGVFVAVALLTRRNNWFPVARYFDLFENLVVRGLIFLTVGALLFVEGALFKRARRRAEPVNT